MRLSALLQNARTPRLLLTLVCALPLAAAAHTGVDGHAHFGFVAGFAHPLTGMDHLAAMVAVGLWSALSARRVSAGLLWGPAGFAGMLLLGALIGLQGVMLPAVEPMIAASLLVTGLLVVSRWHVPGFAAALLVGGFALFHGLAHGSELAGNANAWASLGGMMAATVLLHAAGVGLGWTLRNASAWISRTAGAAVAVFGVGLLSQLA